MGRIKIAIAGVGNCASFLLQSVEYYRNSNGQNIPGVLWPVIGSYHISDIVPVAAFDVDAKKVGKDLSEAIFEQNSINTEKIADVPHLGVEVLKAPVLDGIGSVLGDFVHPDKSPAVDVAKALEESDADMLINYLPVGSYEATRYFADCALKAGAGYVNCIPEFISSDAQWAKRFQEAGVPIVGDDIKGQLGASILSRTLVKLFSDRGCKVERMYQLNFGGNTDFINLLERSRLKYKKISKTETVQSQLLSRLDDENIHIGPSDYVPWLRSRKIAHIRIEGRTFGNVPIYIDAKLDVEDKSVSAGVVIDAIRCAKLALDRGTAGPLISISAYTMKSPPQQFPDTVAKQMVEEFIKGERER